VVNWATFCNVKLIEPINIGFPIYNTELKITEDPADVIFNSLVQINFQNCQELLNIIFTMSINLNITEEEFFQGLYNNIEKLKIRYKEKFTTTEALERNLDLERETLKTNIQ